ELVGDELVRVTERRIAGHLALAPGEHLGPVGLRIVADADEVAPAVAVLMVDERPAAREQRPPERDRLVRIVPAEDAPGAVDGHRGLAQGLARRLRLRHALGVLDAPAGV